MRWDEGRGSEESSCHSYLRQTPTTNHHSAQWNCESFCIACAQIQAVREDGERKMLPPGNKPSTTWCTPALPCLPNHPCRNTSLRHALQSCPIQQSQKFAALRMPAMKGRKIRNAACKQCCRGTESAPASHHGDSPEMEPPTGRNKGRPLNTTLL
jgi:hypothetical protein